MFFDFIANLLNSISRFFGSSSTPIISIGPSAGSPEQPSPGGHPVTVPENIGANFYSTGAAAWANQPGGQHFGTDFRANQGTPVYAPFPGKVVKIGFYPQSGLYGHYVIMTLVDGAEYYSGHLQNVKVRQGDIVTAGQQLGETNELNHTHVQLKISGKLTDFEAYRRGK